MGAEKKTVIALLIWEVLFCSSCEVIDISGFIYNDEPVNARVEQSLEWNESHPAREIIIPGTEYNLMIAGDLHVGGIVNLDTFLSEAVKNGTSGLVLTGDLTIGHLEDYLILKQEFDSKNTIPAFLMVGNHDLYFDGWKTYFGLFGSSTYSFTVKTDNTTDLYIILDSGSATCGWKQSEWFKNLLEHERKNVRHCIIFTHNNLFRTRRTLATNPMVDELRYLMDLCYTYSVDMVIMGHDHERSEEFLGKTRYVTLDALEDENEDASYLKLQVTNNGLAYSFVRL